MNSGIIKKTDKKIAVSIAFLLISLLLMNTVFVECNFVDADKQKNLTLMLLIKQNPALLFIYVPMFFPSIFWLQARVCVLPFTRRYRVWYIILGITGLLLILAGYIIMDVPCTFYQCNYHLAFSIIIFYQLFFSIWLLILGIFKLKENHILVKPFAKNSL